MSRMIQEYDAMPTRVKTSPHHAAMGRGGWDEREVRANFRAEPKWKEERRRMNRERISSRLDDGYGVA